MAAIFKIPKVGSNPNQDQKQAFIRDVYLGLSKAKKSIDSKYFYDERGSELFNRITHHPDYYLTECELNIIDCYKKELANLFKNETINLIELGPGEGIKTRLLIDQFLSASIDFSYYSIDISKRYLNQIMDKFKQELPNLKTTALHSDYLNGVKWLSKKSKKRNFLLFLGSSIGNFNLHEAKEFLSLLHSFLHPGDYVFIGFDLLKEIDFLLRAYNDKDGLTTEFNLNLLKRINKELGANFNMDSFYHYGNYNVESKAMESYLISKKTQQIYIEALKQSFHFNEFEALHTESSQKYSFRDIRHLASEAQFKLIRNFTDKKQFFTNSLWQVQ